MQTVKYRFLGALLLVMMAASSCVKNSGYADTIDDSNKYLADISEAGASDNVQYQLEPNPPVETLKAFQVRIGSKEVPNKDITVKLVASPTLVADYNSHNGTSYVVPTATQIAVATYDVVIKAGSRTVDVPITITKANLDFSNTYAMGFKIADGGGATIASNTSEIVVVVGVKNKYDGVYTFKARFAVPSDRPAAFEANPFTYPVDISMITAGASSVKMLNPAFGTEGFHPLINGGATSGFGSTRPQFTFNSSDAMTSVVNAFPNPSNGRAFIMNDAITTSRYDPAKKIIYAAIIMTQPGFAPMPLFDTLIYKGPRP